MHMRAQARLGIRDFDCKKVPITRTKPLREHMCRSGRLLAGGEPDFHSVSVNIINDYQRGKLPYFVAPPLADGETPKSVAAEPTVKATFDVQAATAAVEAAAALSVGEGDGGQTTGSKKKKEKKRKKLTQKEEEAEEDLAALEAEEAARLAKFEAEDSDSDADAGSEDNVASTTMEKKAKASSSSPSNSTGNSSESRSKKRKASTERGADVDVEAGGAGIKKKKVVGEAGEDASSKGKGSGREGLRRSKRRAADMEDAGAEESVGKGHEKRKKGRSVKASTAEEHEDLQSVDDDEDVVEDDEGAMPSIGEGLAWDDLS